MLWRASRRQSPTVSDAVPSTTSTSQRTSNIGASGSGWASELDDEIGEEDINHLGVFEHVTGVLGDGFFQFGLPRGRRQRVGGLRGQHVENRGARGHQQRGLLLDALGLFLV